MSEFRPYGLFYDALSAEFRPPTDPQRGIHTLARLATAACENGTYDSVEDAYTYSPSWAEHSYVMVSQPDDERPFRTQLVLSDLYGRWPRQVRFTNTASNAAMGPRRNNLVIVDSDRTERVLPLELSQALREARSSVANAAQNYYDGLKRQ